jgi:hypothetical protein
MEYLSKKVKCQNCGNNFIIEPDDFLFYEKMKVPPPTFCPECRLQRKLAWRNERNLYKRKCDSPGHDEFIISIYPPNSKSLVYDSKYWWSDKWDASIYNKNYDFSKTLFEQWNELFNSVPNINVINIDPVNSDYCNFTYQSKNCYLNFASDMNEDTGYLYHSIENRNCYDMLGSRKNENCYEMIDSEGCYGCTYLFISEGCVDSKYCYDCRNCQNCIGCYGLRNSKYYIFNQKYTPEEYKKETLNLKLETSTGKKYTKEKFNELILKHPRKFFNSRHVENCTGDYIKNAQNCEECFDIEGPAQNLKYTSYGVTNMKDLYDGYAIGVNIEKCCDVFDAGDNMSGVVYSGNIWNSFDCSFCYFLRNCSNCFACIGLRNKQYCILNRQYTKEEYEELVPKIIKHMNDMPYIDSKGREYRYGEFFPSELSPFCYNETIAQEYFPLTKEEAQEQGYKWKDKEERNYNIDIKNEDIPDDITTVNDDITSKIIECGHKGECNHQCTEAFKITPEELQFYKRMNLPIPHLCPNCRHYERLNQRNPLKLWHRACMKEGCNNEFETSYAPERPEIVYCEKCYQQEVY